MCQGVEGRDMLEEKFSERGKDLDCRVTFTVLLSNPASLPAHNYDIELANHFYLGPHSLLCYDLCMVVTTPILRVSIDLNMAV